MLAAIIPLVARAGPEIPVPFFSVITYAADDLLVLVILLLGTAMGARRKFPLWSYTWVVVAMGSTATFFAALLPTLLLDRLGSGVVAIGWLVTLSHLGGGLLILAFAASRATLGQRYAFFVSGIYLVSFALKPYIQFLPNSASPIGAAIMNTVSILITVIILAVIVAMVMRFFYGDTDTQRRSVYGLIAIALLEPIFTGLVLALRSAGTGDILNLAGIFGTVQLVRWTYVAATLLITFALVLLFLRFQKAKVNSPASSGGIDG